MVRRLRIWKAVSALAVVNVLAAHGCSGPADTSSTSTGATASSSSGATGTSSSSSGTGGSGTGGGPVTPPCDVTAPTSCPDPAPTYADVMPILTLKCQPCHSGVPNGPWPLTDYDHVADWQNEIRTELLACSMPPLDGGVTITDEERMLLLTWVRCGVPK
ncbi:Hypothetical protein A7982_07094 [Minicystis rosea]|nr:Hypothetical protein A7982_07094 [Minicystis rosea]